MRNVVNPQSDIDRNAGREPDAVLVVPPFFSVLHSSLGVSSLKGALAEAGHRAKVIYLNLDLAHEIGLELHEWLSTEADHRWLLGEWLFAPFLGGERDQSLDDAYLRRLRALIPGERLDQVLRARESLAGWLDSWAERLADLSPSVLGFSTSYQQNCCSLALARLVKARSSEVLICFGGANCEGAMGPTLAETFPQIDLVLAGEGEGPLVELVERRKGLRPHPPPHFPLPASDRTAVAAVEDLPLPDLSDYFEALDRLPIGRWIEPGISFESSRGCWWGMKHHCRFCGVNGEAMRFRSKSPERLLGELDALSERWGARRFTAVDAVLAPKLVRRVFDVLAERGSPYEVFFQVRSDLSHDQLSRLARGGLSWIIAGVESLDTGLLRLLDKGSTRLNNVRFLRDVLEIGIRPFWFVLHRIPGETSAAFEGMTALLPDLEHLPPPVGLVPIHIDRFSPYFCDPEAHGITDLRPLAVYEMVYQLPEDRLRGLAYHFEGELAAAADPGVIDDLRDGLRGWTARFFGPEGRPLLASVPAPGGAFVTDSRSVAVERWCYLGPEEWGLLSSFRRPASIDAVLEQHSPAGPSARRAFDELCRRRFILVEGERAVSLVAESGHLVYDWDVEKASPGGFVRPVSGPTAPSLR